MRSLLCFLLCLISATVWSQTVTYDTIVEIKEVDVGIYDTILYVKKHVQINEEVVVVDTVSGDKRAFDAYTGMLLTSSAIVYSETDLTFNSSEIKGYCVGGSFYYNFSKKLSVRLGAKLDYHKITGNYTKADKYMVKVFGEVDDTLDTYYNVKGTDTNYFHIIEPKTIQKEEEITDYSDISYNWELYFLKIPIQASYALEWNRWNFSFLAGTSLNFLLKDIEIKGLESQKDIISFYPSGIASIQAGYFVTNSTIVQVEPFFEKHFVNRENNLVSSNQFSLCVGLKQIF